MSEDAAFSPAGRLATLAEVKKLIGHCAFCGKSQSDVKMLISGPSVFICNDCVRVCNEVMENASEYGATREEDGEATEEGVKVAAGELLLTFPTECLCSALASQEGTLEQVRAQMQATVNILRGRGVSWAVIGKALGVSRQAAWERFS